MKAVVCRELGLADKLELATDWPEPDIGEHDVSIDVKAAGVNFPDVLIIQNKYQFKPELPFTPGSEVAGVVNAVGEGVSHLKAGDHVIACDDLYGGTYRMFVRVYSRFGVEFDYVDPVAGAGAVEAALRPNTKMV